MDQLVPKWKVNEALLLSQKLAKGSGHQLILWSVANGQCCCINQNVSNSGHVWNCAGPL